MTLAEQQRIKRKLDDYVDDDLDLASSSSSSFVRMRKDDRNPNPQPQPQNPIQFFVRTISGGTTLVLRGYPHDTIELIHRKIHSATGIPIMDQRLIYCGKQLQSEHTLSHYRITNDAGLHLVARMRSTGHPLVWQLVDDLVSVICRACRGVVGQGASTSIKLKLTEFLNMLPTTDDHDHDDDHDHNHNHNHRDRSAAPYLDIFLSSSAPAALVMLYFSPHPGNKECALDSVQHFIKSLPRLIYSQFAPILLDFCKLLRRAAFHDDPLYKLCRTSLASMVHYINLATRNSNASSYNNMAIALPDIFPFMNELATKLSQDLVSSMESVSNSGPSSSDVHDFGAFLQPLRSAIIGHGTPLPEVKDEYEELHEMLIDRSQLLAESFEYISGAEPGALRSGLFMEFKNEEATGPGVLREWFFLVCQAIFDPQNALFLVCPNDRRRFFPNPASKVDPMHLRYFKFAGRVIALALMHKMQVGIVFDRAFFLQLGGVDVCLEDIKDADPYLYSSCKQILDMDARAVDEDALGLTFVWEAEELGSMKLLELVPDGKLISVNSRNRKEYVDLLVKHRFVTSVAQQVTEFARGFTDIVTSEEIRKLCFKSLLLEDLDGMLHGSESPISVEDWKAHTEYNGYKCTDPQIKWFWKIVGEMTAEQRKVLLFFWTSVKYLPVEGFCGLASRLYIYKSGEGDRLPSSHTCFFRICFPAYRQWL
ncbi:putative HECT domain, Ubiquitin-like domain, Ubiquitin-like domain superfamily [Helianthus annuus]|nr:putative HECT domain, Ubiquitin-like domain, Ubiquitin-like domain superfamily [Helianthus annuus]